MGHIGKRKFKAETIEGFSDFNRLGTMPLMSELETKTIVKYLKPEYVMFEWGSGGSTVYFPQFVKRYYSVEHQSHWFRMIRNKLRHMPEIRKRVNIMYKPQSALFGFKDNDFKRGWFMDYIESIGTVSEKRFDAILVDGENRTRRFCAEEARKYMDEDSVLFIHDYDDRPDTHKVEEIYDIIEKVEDDNSLVVMKVKK